MKLLSPLSPSSFDYSLSWNDWGGAKPADPNTTLLVQPHYESANPLFNGIASDCAAASLDPLDHLFITPTCGDDTYAYYGERYPWEGTERDGFTFISVMHDYYRPELPDNWLMEADLYVGAFDATDRSTFSYLRTDMPATVTPEPISLVLLGSGLAGIAAVRRRRRQNSEE